MRRNQATRQCAFQLARYRPVALLDLSIWVLRGCQFILSQQNYASFTTINRRTSSTRELSFIKPQVERLSLLSEIERGRTSQI